MSAVVGGIGDAGTEILTPLNKRDNDGDASRPQQVRGEKHAARSAAYDDNARHRRRGALRILRKSLETNVLREAAET